MLAVLSQPEWPVAALVLERFLVHLNSEAGLKSTSSAVRQLSVELLGTVAAALVSDVALSDADADWVMEATRVKGRNRSHLSYGPCTISVVCGPTGALDVCIDCVVDT